MSHTEKKVDFKSDLLSEMEKLEITGGYESSNDVNGYCGGSYCSINCTVINPKSHSLCLTKSSNCQTTCN